MDGAEEKFVNLWPAEARLESSDHSDERDGTPSDGVLQLECMSPPLSLQDKGPITYETYESELQMPDIMRLMKAALSEPYSIYTYRYFIHNWPQLCILAKSEGVCVGAVVCKLEMHGYNRRGYIAMLAVDENHRKKKIGQFITRETLYLE